MTNAGRVADTVRATGVALPAVEEALAVVVALVVTRYALLFFPLSSGQLSY